MNDERPSPYPLRMPASLRRTLEEFAKANGHSMNSEILARLHASVSIESQVLESPDAQQFILSLNDKINDMQRAIETQEKAMEQLRAREGAARSKS